MTTRRHRRLIAVALAGLFVVGLAALMLDRKTQSSERAPVAYLDVTAPKTVDAGEGFEVEVANVLHGHEVVVGVDGGYGNRLFSGEVNNGVARVFVEPALGPESGTLMVRAVAHDAVGTTLVELVPGRAVDPLDLYLGPRTVIADENDFSMIVAVPKDSFGNPVAERTPVQYTVSRKGEVAVAASAPTSGLVSYHRVFSRTTATRTRVAATVGSATGPERSFLEVAGVPLKFDLEMVDDAPLADGHTLARIRTTDLVDEFGNQLPDGSMVYLDTEGVAGVGRLRSVTIEGQAEFVFEAPDTPGTASFIATASGTTSNKLEVSFLSAVAELPVELALVTVEGSDGLRNAVEVVVGRVTSVRGSYVPDGTIVRVRTDKRTYETPLELGAGILTLPETSGVAEVLVLGTTTRVDLTDAEPAS